MNMKRTDSGEGSASKVRVCPCMCVCVWEVCLGMCSVFKLDK